MSVLDMTKKLFPPFAIGCLIKNKYKSVSKVKKIPSPTLIIHSKDDMLVPYSHGINLYENLNTEKLFLEIYGSHNEGFILTGTKYTDTLRSFIFEE